MKFSKKFLLDLVTNKKCVLYGSKETENPDGTLKYYTFEQDGKTYSFSYYDSLLIRMKMAFTKREHLCDIFNDIPEDSHAADVSILESFSEEEYILNFEVECDEVEYDDVFEKWVKVKS